ncbi:MAG TPA: hypothetical protein VIZ28_07125 [Chitinophagaceae bacterium]
MPLYYYFLLAMLLSGIIFLIRYFILRRKSIPAELFVTALRNENSGNFEAAVIVYESALDEAKKHRFNNGLQNKINRKLKLLHSVIEYEKNLRFTR